jgi:hypothetical protein
MVDAIGVGQVKPENPGQQNSPDRLPDVAGVGQDRGVDACVEEHPTVSVPDQERLKGQRHPATPEEHPPKPGQLAPIAMLCMLLGLSAGQDSNRRNRRSGSAVGAHGRCL